jgi:hypothetical protein
MASNVLCGNCGAFLRDERGPCWSCGASASAAAWSAARKSRWAAAALAVIPGLGHLYLGEWKKAVFFMLGCGGLEFLGLDLDLTVIGDVVGVPMGLGGVGLWAFSIWDAYRTARAREQFAPAN